MIFFPFFLIHGLISFGLFYVLQLRFKRISAFIGAIGFAVYPGHAYSIACGEFSLGMTASYLLALGGVFFLALGFERVQVFLASQEKLISVLFLVAVAALILGMAVLSLQYGSVFKNQESVWRFRVKQVGTPKAFVNLADILRQGPNPAREEIIRLYLKAIEKDKTYDKSYFRLAQLYQEMGNPPKAIATYNDFLKLDPDEERHYVRVIEAYGQAIAQYPRETIYQEKREELLSEYEQFSKRKNYTAADYFNLGFLYQQVGGNEEAMRYYRKALALDHRHEKALYSLANLYQQAGDLKTALGLYLRLININHKSTLAYLNMGIIYNAMGDTTKAKALYQKVIGIDSDNADAYFNLGYLNETAGELKEAINDYEKAVENNPKHAEAYYNMGNVYAALEQRAEAIAAYLKTVAIDPNHQNAYINLSILSFKSKDFEGAIKYLDLASKTGYVPPEGYLKTLEIYRKK